MNLFSQQVGIRIRTYRRKKGLTQEQLAEKAELHPTYIGEIERGEKNPSIVAVQKILSALGTTFPEFFSYLDAGEPAPTIATQCYDLINSKSPSQQRHIYRILQELDSLSKE